MKKALSLFATLIVLSLAAAAFVGCSGTKHDYTVKVIGLDGKPCTTVTVQVCEIDENGGGACYKSHKTDKNGMAYFDVGDGGIPTTASTLEIHIRNADGSKLPLYLAYDKTQLKRGENATITLRIRGEGEYDSYLGGNGTANYLADDPTKLDLSAETFKPYEVRIPSDGLAYELKFTSAAQKIYFKVSAESDFDYNVFSYGGVDAKITELVGDETKGIVKSDDAKYSSDNISDSDKNFSYNFTVENGSDGEGADFRLVYQYHYFEVTLQNADQVNVSGLICFKPAD